MVDDQTIQDNPNASTTRQTIRSKRTYLCDASFVAVVVPGPTISVGQLARAAVAPVFVPFLGRRACAPSTPLLLEGKVEGEDPLELFQSIPRTPEPLIRELREKRQLDEGLDFYLDVDDYPSALRRLRVREDLRGPLPRQFRERTVVHVRRQMPAATPSSDTWTLEESV